MITLGPALRFNGGGHINHSIFWQNLSPNGGGTPQGELLTAIVKDFGSFENFKNVLSTSTVAIQGSGWGWLGYNKTTKNLVVTAQPNQDPLEATTGTLRLSLINTWKKLIMTYFQVLFLCWVLMFGSTPTTYSTRMYARITWKICSTSLIGMMLRRDLLLLVNEYSNRLSIVRESN